MEINNLFGLPAHPILVHAAVVLLPIAAIGAIVLALVPKLRKQFSILLVLVALGAVGSVGLAQGSGEQLEERIVETKLVERHTDEGESVLPWAFAVLVAAGSIALAPMAAKKFDKLTPKLATGILVVGSTIAGIGATYTVIDVGHSGAEAVWSNTPDRSSESSESGGDQDDNSSDSGKTDQDD